MTIRTTRLTQNALSISQDASNRTRVSQSTTQFDGKLLNSDSALLFDSKGTGTGSYAANKFNMSVTSGQYYIRQSKRFASYLAGKSQQVEVTFDGFATEANVVKRCGYFSSSATGVYDEAYDGFWLENNGTTILLKVARAGTETLSIPITSWSGYDQLAEYQNLATWNNFTVVAFDFLWLGGAVLRMYVKTSAGLTLAHVFGHAGTAADLMMLSPNQPVRYEIRSTTGSGSFRMICSQVSTEGSIEEAGYNNSNHSILTAGIPSQTVAAVGTSYAVCGVRKKSTHRDVNVKVTSTDLIVRSIEDNDVLHWELLLNPTLSTPLTYSAMSNSACEFGVAGAATAISITSTGGRSIHSGHLSSRIPIPTGALDRDFFSYLGCTIDNVMDQIVLVVTPITSDIELNGSINWKEY